MDLSLYREKIVYHFASLRKTIISKCSADSLARSGVNTRPPREKRRSIAALAGKPVLSFTYNCLMAGKQSSVDSSDDRSARYLSTSALASSPVVSNLILCFLAAEICAKKSDILDAVSESDVTGDSVV
jgi:hypothetical protein